MEASSPDGTQWNPGFGLHNPDYAGYPVISGKFANQHKPEACPFTEIMPF